jgi:AraC-like DNA-binding protein
MPPAAMVALFSAAIVAHARPIPPEHLRLIEAVRAWMGQSLSPRVADLGPAAGMSQRQVQRLVDRYFGHPPKALVRKYRALRAASVLADPAATAEEIDAVIDHFYDQSHLIREIRLFAGRTPARIADPGTPFLMALLDRRNFRDGLPRIAPLPKDLRT